MKEFKMILAAEQLQYCKPHSTPKYMIRKKIHPWEIATIYLPCYKILQIPTAKQKRRQIYAYLDRRAFSCSPNVKMWNFVDALEEDV